MSRLCCSSILALRSATGNFRTLSSEGPSTLLFKSATCISCDSYKSRLTQATWKADSKGFTTDFSQSSTAASVKFCGVEAAANDTFPKVLYPADTKDFSKSSLMPIFLHRSSNEASLSKEADDMAF